jgi:hypothetical protein
VDEWKFKNPRMLDVPERKRPTGLISLPWKVLRT